MKLDTSIFQKHDEEYLRFDCVANRHSDRRDLNALILLDLIVPGHEDIISGASHDEIYLSIEPAVLLANADETQIVDLIRCGIRYDSGTDSLSMFV